MAELYITKELLEQKGACAEGIAYFEKLFPEGCALTDKNINQVRDCKISFIWWFTENICPDERLYALCGVSGSNGVSWSEGVNRSKGVSDSIGIVNCHGVSNALFLADVPQKYTLFGQEVSEGYFEKVKHKLCKILGDWRPQYYDEEGREISNQEAWADMPQEAIDYVRSWPEFDPAMFERITGIRTEKV